MTRMPLPKNILLSTLETCSIPITSSQAVVMRDAGLIVGVQQQFFKDAGLKHVCARRFCVNFMKLCEVRSRFQQNWVIKSSRSLLDQAVIVQRSRTSIRVLDRCLSSRLY